MMKDNNLERAVDITGLLNINIEVFCLLEIDASIEAFLFCKWFYRFNKKTYYFQQVGRDCFQMCNASLVRLP